ncbi:MAG: hypothetical protein ACI8TA_003204, partial [Cyclobacteriaceae bacterium]
MGSRIKRVIFAKKEKAIETKDLEVLQLFFP